MDPYVGEIRPVAFNFAPNGWALCQGQVMSINQNVALFSLLGTYFGGNGVSTFALPNLQGSLVVGNGQGPGLSAYSLGQMGGSASVTLTTTTMPLHVHTIPVNPMEGVGSDTPGPGTILGGNPQPRHSGSSYYVNPQTQGGTVAKMANVAGMTGGGQPHNNMAPYVAMQYIISLQGIYPPRP